MRVIPVTEENLPAVRAFLEARADTAQFLLSNLASCGPRLGTAPISGNFKCIGGDGTIRAVFCLTRRGNLLIETGGRTDFTTAITGACIGEPVELRGVIGEWESARAAWDQLKSEGRILERLHSREWLYALDLTRAGATRLDVRARALVPGDFRQVEPLQSAFMIEAGVPNTRSLEERRTVFEKDAEAARHWGYFDVDRLVAIACFTAVHAPRAQIGGVYTAPEQRRRGRCRSVMQKLIDDAVKVHGLSRLILFTAEDNGAAQRLYESLGFERIGDYGLFFGEPAPGQGG